MKENGKIRRKKGFTVTGNKVARDKKLSFKAKGLYLLIASYITLDYEGFTLTKSFLKTQCNEGEKAFESTWKELKQKGYLRVYLKPIKGRWSSEYELLDEVDNIEKVGVIHTYYLNTKGEIVSNNLDREEHIVQKETINNRTPQNGSNGNISNGKRNNNINISNNTFNNTLNHSINHKSIDKQNREKKDKIVNDLIHKYSDLNLFYDSHLYEGERLELYNLLKISLIEMCTSESIMCINDMNICAEDILNQLELCIEREEEQTLEKFIQMTIDDFLYGSQHSEIKYIKSYMKACIWNSFFTYNTKAQNQFYHTYNKTLWRDKEI